jgi:uncharacterized membrane protein YtjA (UPF0391 family)
VALLRWSLGLLTLTVIAALFGFGGLAPTSAGIARVLFYLFAVGFLVSLVAALFSGRRPSL